MIADDPLTPWLQARGVSVAPHFLGNTTIRIGCAINYKHAYLAWRVDTVSQRVWILLIRHDGTAKGLANPFAVLYLLAKATLAVLGAGYVLYGNVDIFADSRLSGERLQYFYLHWTGACQPEPGWFMLAVEKVSSLRDMRKRQKSGPV